MNTPPPDGFLNQIDHLERIGFELAPSGVGVITLTRPERLNAFDLQMLAELRSLVWRANFDSAIKALVITGAGRGFCSGRDIVSLQYENGLPTPQYRAYVRANHEAFDDLEALEKPVIAAINGVCAGGGVELAVACELRVASRSAQFLLPETQLGVIPASGACSRMIQMIGMGVSHDDHIGRGNARVVALAPRIDMNHFATELQHHAPVIERQQAQLASRGLHDISLPVGGIGRVETHCRQSE